MKWDPQNRQQQMQLWNRVALLETESKLHRSRIESLTILLAALASMTGNEGIQAQAQAVLDVMRAPAVPSIDR